MIIKVDDYKYLNTDQIVYIMPKEYDDDKSKILFSNGKYIIVDNILLDDILKKLKVEVV